ncbi:MAG: hypothetical protein FWF43_08635 [Propionibacteriaceae bacterium]|nr:hypothetical protein [Propionibacteriaceae bacterium]
MAFFRQARAKTVEVPAQEHGEVRLPVDPPETKDGIRDFWQHWDYLLSMVPELAEFGVPILDAVGLTLNEAILAENDIGRIKATDVLIDKGTRVVPRMLSLLTGMGITKVMARPNPRVLVMALSDRAIPASYLAAGQAQEGGAQAHRMEYIFNSPDHLLTTISEQLVRADLVVTVGGLGEGGVDFRAIADQIGPNDFTPVAVSPGRDHGFVLAEEKIPLLALPADVYPAFVLTKLLLEPMIAKLMGASTDPAMSVAYLAQPLRIAPHILTCVPATVRDSRMRISGRPHGLEGMNEIYRANALAILASEDGVVDLDSEAFYQPLT